MVFGHDIVAVMDAERPHYEQAMGGFLQVCSCSSKPAGGVKSVNPLTMHRLIIGGMNVDQITTSIQAHRPDLIIAMGNRSLRAAAKIHNVPILYLMVNNPAHIIAGHNNITGINFKLTASVQLESIHTHLQDLKRLGVIYDPRRTGKLIDKAQIAAPNYAMELLAHPIASRNEMPQLLHVMQKENLDGFWMIPDLTVLSPATIQEILLFSLENKIPLITFADKYLQQGAAVAITVNLPAMGVQAGKMALSILAGKPIATIPPEPAKQSLVNGNDLIIKKMGVNFKTTTPAGGTQ